MKTSDDKLLQHAIRSLNIWLDKQSDYDAALQAMMIASYSLISDLPEKQASISFTDAVIKISVEEKGVVQ